MVDPGRVVDLIKDARDRRTAPLILELDLSEGIIDAAPADPLSALMSMRRTHLRDVLEGLRRARTDDRVRALVVKIGCRGGAGDGPGAARRGPRLPGRRQAHGGVGGDVRRDRPRHRAVLPRHRLRADLAAAVRRRRADRVALEEPFFTRRAGQGSGSRPSSPSGTSTRTRPTRFTEREYTARARGDVRPARRPRSASRSPRGSPRRRGLSADRVRELIDRGPLSAAEALEAGLVDRARLPRRGLRRASAGARPTRSRRCRCCATSTRYQPAARGSPPRAAPRRDGRGRADPGPGADPAGPQRPRAAARRRRDGLRHRRRGAPGGRPGRPGQGDRLPGRTAPAARTSPPTRSGARSCRARARPASRSSSRWATSPARAATSSRWPPTRSSPSPARSPARSACSAASRSSAGLLERLGVACDGVGHGRARPDVHATRLPFTTSEWARG